MKQRSIGDRQVGAVGLGAMPFSTEAGVDRGRAIATLHAALDAGVTLIDTADAYGPPGTGLGYNEQLVAEALAQWDGERGALLVATKGGALRHPDGSWALDGSPEHLARAARDSADRLGVEMIDLYQFHRPDPSVPFEDSLGALQLLVEEGVVRAVGVSNTSVAEIRTAHRLLGPAFVSVQNRFSPGWRDSAVELEACVELGIAFLPWSPLGGIGHADVGDEVFAEVAGEMGTSPQRVALAWELALAHVMIPIPGASRPETIRDSAAATELDLTPEQVGRLSAGAYPPVVR